MTCPVCTGSSLQAYDNLIDKLVGAQGKWEMSRCIQQSCRLYCLDPMPAARQRCQLYDCYYTHETGDLSSQLRMWRRTYRHIVEGYLEHRFGYIFPGRRTFAAHMWPLLYAFPLRRQREERNVMWLPSRKDQLLLDVGCGSGAFMRRMGNLGWRVEGVDFDPGAVAFAQSCGCKALCGSVEDMCYPSNHFDVVVMNHVIEHLSDPISSLKECFRILRPGGKIAVATPNVQSLGHKCFGRSWRGLEPPRHLYLFGFCSLDRLLLAAGFDDRHIYSYVALSVLEASLCLKFKFMAPRSNGAIRQLIQLCALLLSLAEYFVGHFRPYMGECLAAQAVKPR